MSTISYDFRGQAALVTGAASGMGLAAARAFAAAGAAVALADINADALRAVTQELAAAGHRVVGVPGDIADETYYTWLARQPAKVQDEVLGATGGDALRSGELSAKDLVKYEKAEPLTFAQFSEKIVNILAR